MLAAIASPRACSAACWHSSSTCTGTGGQGRRALSGCTHAPCALTTYVAQRAAPWLQKRPGLRGCTLLQSLRHARPWQRPEPPTTLRTGPWARCARPALSHPLLGISTLPLTPAQQASSPPTPHPPKAVMHVCTHAQERRAEAHTCAKTCVAQCSFSPIHTCHAHKRQGLLETKLMQKRTPVTSILLHRHTSSTSSSRGYQGPTRPFLPSQLHPTHLVRPGKRRIGSLRRRRRALRRAARLL